MPDGGSGFPGWFIALFVIFGVIILTGFIVAIARSIWQFSVLRSGGLNPLVAKEQLEARLNQRLTTPPAPPPPATPATPAAPAGKSIEQRLAELQDLHVRGVITADELAAGRAKIIGGE
ncbi:MAG TPA: hypothetical protein VK823_05185 [Streptosporangiaceae bacterium]|nr:hypothetical protein [Streptosporangiaceae bacterium]